ncbi:MAG: hypothetical protein ABI601_21750 [bacterium]
MRQTVEKAIEIRVAMRKHLDGFAGGEPGQVMLNRVRGVNNFCR